MKKGCLLLLLILILAPGSIIAQGHRIGVALGSASGIHEQNGEQTTFKGEILELPLYTFVAKNGLLVGFRLMEFSINGKTKSGLQHTDMTLKQSLLGASLGLEIKIGNNVIIAPQIIKSYMGNSHFNYSTYDTYSVYPDHPYKYVIETDTVTGTADLSGWEIPVYWVGKYFYFGGKFCAYSSKTEIERPGVSVSEISITGALSLVMEARF
jgi:hypothetical protein